MVLSFLKEEVPDIWHEKFFTAWPVSDYYTIPCSYLGKTDGPVINFEVDGSTPVSLSMGEFIFARRESKRLAPWLINEDRCLLGISHYPDEAETDDPRVVFGDLFLQYFTSEFTMFRLTLHE